MLNYLSRERILPFKSEDSMHILYLILLSFTAILFLPVFIFTFQVIAGLLPYRKKDYSLLFRPSIAVLVPAHNEAATITATLLSIKKQINAGDRIMVVADNCTDDTASVARTLGAEVVERTDHDRRGKGYALDFGFRHLEEKPSDVVIIVDADCLLENGALDCLSKQSFATNRPVQAQYLMTAPGGSLKMKVAEFATIVKNLVRPLGLLNLGLPCQLMGTGMAFPWSLLKKVNLANGHLVEDMKLGLDLARIRHAPVFCPDALVTSVFPVNAEGIKSQRTRWEHGHLNVIIKDVPGLLMESVRTFNGLLAILVLDLSVPPLAMLVLLTIAVLFLSIGLWFATGIAIPLVVTFLEIVLIICVVLLAWMRYGRKVIPFANLVFVPVYVLWKIPMYMKYIWSRQTEWVRSRRD